MGRARVGVLGMARTLTPWLRVTDSGMAVTSTGVFVASYVAQTIGLATMVAVNIILPLVLGPGKYATFVGLVGVGYLATQLADQVFNTALAFEIGTGARQALGRIVAAKGLLIVPAMVLLWLLLSRTVVSLVVSAALGVAFSLSTAFETWALASGRADALVVLKLMAASIISWAFLAVRPLSAEMAAIVLTVSYSLGAVGCAVVLIAEGRGLGGRHVPFPWAQLGLAGPMLWPAVYSWLVPLVMIHGGFSAEAATYKLAVGALVASVATLPVPSALLSVAVAARTELVPGTLSWAAQRVAILAVVSGTCVPTVVWLDGRLLSTVLAHTGYATIVAQLQVVLWSLLPVLLNPLLCARAFAMRGQGWVLVLTYGIAYVGCTALASISPSRTAMWLVLTQWATLVVMSSRNADLLAMLYRKAMTPSVAAAIALLGAAMLTVLLPAWWVVPRLMISVLLVGALVVTLLRCVGPDADAAQPD